MHQPLPPLGPKDGSVSRQSQYIHQLTAKAHPLPPDAIIGREYTSWLVIFTPFLIRGANFHFPYGVIFAFPLTVRYATRNLQLEIGGDPPGGCELNVCYVLGQEVDVIVYGAFLALQSCG
jgi:hypothetical protein